jgi:hypothetical protein
MLLGSYCWNCIFPKQAEAFRRWLAGVPPVHSPKKRNICVKGNSPRTIADK